MTAPNLSLFADSLCLCSVGSSNKHTASYTASVSKSLSTPSKSKISTSSTGDRPFRCHRACCQSQRPSSGTTSLLDNSGRQKKKLRTNGIENEGSRGASHGGSKQYNVGSLKEDDRTTESLSPSYRLSQTRTPAKDHESQQCSISVIDLTTPERPVSDSYPTPTSKTVHAKHFRSAIITGATPSATSVKSEASGHSIEQWHNEVRPQQAHLSSGSQPQFTTHTTPFLQKVTANLDMAHFRPAYIARDVGVLERGYWQFWIETRRPSKPRTRLFGSTAPRRRDKAGNPIHGLWTEDELFTTWKSMATSIELGRAGPDTWVSKDSTDGIVWRIRIFGWGEILAHLWFLLFVLSNKLTGEIPMQWVAADGKTVVRMSPGHNLAGLWQRSGPPGAKGVWTFFQG